MRNAWALGLVLAAALLLAGCSGSTNDSSSAPRREDSKTSAPPSETEGPTSTTSQTSGPTTSGGPGANRAPTVASLVATGGAGLLVNYTFEASDPDSDPLTWSLDFGDGSAPATGSALPGQASHTFAAAGNFTATLTVSDGKASATKEALVNVVAGGGGGAFEPISATLTTAILCEQCTDAGDTVTACASWNAQQKGVDCSWMDLPANAVGEVWTVVGVDGAGLGSNPQVAFTDACAADAMQLAWFETDSTDTETGTVPDGALCMVVMDYAWFENTYTVTVG